MEGNNKAAKVADLQDTCLILNSSQFAAGSPNEKYGSPEGTPFSLVKGGVNTPPAKLVCGALATPPLFNASQL
jgi:hypothetical protein